MKSLLIASAPRSGSTMTFRFVRDALPRLDGKWPGTAAAFGGEVISHTILKDVNRTKERPVVTRFLNEHKQGRILKDAGRLVPIARYLAKNPDAYNVLYIQRNPADCVHRLLNKKWIWPIGFPRTREHQMAHERALRFVNTKDWEYRKLEIIPWLVDGVLAAQAIMSPLATETIYYEQLIKKPGTLFTRLESMGYEPNWFDYLTPEFKKARVQALAIRKTPLWEMIERCVWMRSPYAKKIAGQLL